jgi:hypothetical protein
LASAFAGLTVWQVAHPTEMAFPFSSDTPVGIIGDPAGLRTTTGCRSPECGAAVVGAGSAPVQPARTTDTRANNHPKTFDLTAALQSGLRAGYRLFREIQELQLFYS